MSDTGLSLVCLFMTRRRVQWFLLRREPYYHKIQYSKVPKSDVAAALLGAIVGAFVAYLTLSSVGSGGTDLTDLAVILWYAGLLYGVWHTAVFLSKTGLRAADCTP